jgi:hypothetical protein
MKRHAHQGSLFGYISPVTGDVSCHPPLCACGKCQMPIERFAQPIVAVLEGQREAWEPERAE